ncbi:MAG: M23 family metallopeptidase, partial [Oscillospiraceae bacterium]|nr:M23 family metallopeptidase [Oscillospiraceae bacterium]
MLTYAYSEFSRLEDVSDPAMYYTGGEVKFEGEISVDITAKKSDVMINDYYFAASGLPTILVDGAERANGRIIPKEEIQPQDGGEVDIYTRLVGENDRIRDSGGNIVRDIKLHNISMAWHYQEQLPEYHWIEAKLSYEPGHSEAMDWAASGLTLPSDEITDEFDFIKYSLSEVTYNSEVRAVDDGEVVFADNGYSWNRGLGKMVIIKHGERLYTILGNMSADKDLCVNVGDKVKAGDVIGYAGNTGHVSPADGKGIVSYYFSSEKPDFFN